MHDDDGGTTKPTLRTGGTVNVLYVDYTTVSTSTHWAIVFFKKISPPYVLRPTTPTGRYTVPVLCHVGYSSPVRTSQYCNK